MGMRHGIILLSAFGVSESAAAQDFEASGLILTKPVPAATAEKIEALLPRNGGWPQDGVTPVKYEEGIGVPRSFIVKGPYYFVDSSGVDRGTESTYPAMNYNQRDGRTKSISVTPTLLNHCKLALAHIRQQRFSPDVQKALGVTLKTYEPVDELVTYQNSADRPRMSVNRLLREAEAAGYYGPYGERYAETQSLEGMLLQTELGFCQANGRGRDYAGIWGIRVSFEFTVSPKTAATTDAAGAPKARQNNVEAPKSRAPTLSVTGPKDAPPPPPEKVVHKPGQAPTPPKAGTPKPCIKEEGPCATQEGGPLTAEGIAYYKKLEAYEAEKRAFEEREAADRAAVADLNRKNSDAYAAQLKAKEQGEADARAARDAKIAADKAAYQAQLKAHRDEADRIQRDHEAQMDAWRRRTAACLAGDLTQCADKTP